MTKKEQYKKIEELEAEIARLRKVNKELEDEGKMQMELLTKLNDQGNKLYEKLADVKNY